MCSSLDGSSSSSASGRASTSEILRQQDTQQWQDMDFCEIVRVFFRERVSSGVRRSEAEVVGRLFAYIGVSSWCSR